MVFNLKFVESEGVFYDANSAISSNQYGRFTGL